MLMYILNTEIIISGAVIMRMEMRHNYFYKMSMFVVALLIVIVVLLCLLLRLVLFKLKMCDSDTDFDIDFDTDIDFDSIFDSDISFDDILDESYLVGGLRAPLEITNWYRTCFIDSVLNSIANSDVLSKRFKNILPENSVSNEQIQNAFLHGIPERKIISSLIEKDMTTQNNKLMMYKLLCSMFIRGIDNNYPKDVLIYITLYIMYLENSSRFNYESGAPVKKMDPTERFYTYMQNVDYNFVIYFVYCEKAIKRIDPKYTGVLDNLLPTRLGLKQVICICDYSEIQLRLDTSVDSDVFIEMICIPTTYDETIVKAMFDICTSRYEGNYRCTDIILDEYKKESDVSYHSVYYNIDENKLHDNSDITKTDINALSKPLDNGNYYVPRILHFQRNV